MRLLLLVGLLLAATLPSPAKAGARVACRALDPDHAAWTSLLRRHVRGDVVDYAGFAATSRPALEAYLSALSGVCRADYERWPRAERLAFWINAYNAYTVRLILDHRPLESIRDIGLLPGAAWRLELAPMEALGRGTLSLDDIEHTILRKELREPRVHFALVCASKGCPALRPEAYRGAALDAQLDDAGRTFLADARKNRLDPATGEVWLSPIFDWFREDFERAAGSMPAFAARFAPEPLSSALRGAGPDVSFTPNDWTLNGR